MPHIFKKVKIVPLYKKGPTNECGNYRPVSLLPSLSKILEKALCSQLMIYLETNQLLCASPFGFCRGSQTTHVVQSMPNIITKHTIDNTVTVVMYYIDLSKAFDCLQYDHLFTKKTLLVFTEKNLEMV